MKQAYFVYFNILPFVRGGTTDFISVYSKEDSLKKEGATNLLSRFLLGDNLGDSSSRFK